MNLQNFDARYLCKFLVQDSLVCQRIKGSKQ